MEEMVKKEPVFLAEDYKLWSYKHWTRNGYQKNFTGQSVREENRCNLYAQNRGQPRYNSYAQKRGQKLYYMRGSSSPKVTCFICHQPWHMVAECSFNTFKAHSSSQGQKQDDEYRRSEFIQFYVL